MAVRGGSSELTPERPTLRESVRAAIFFLLATLLFTWPVAAHISDGLADLWDAKFTAWILHWDFHQTLRDPLHLFDASIFYPAKYALAFSEDLYGAALFGFPMYASGVSTLTAYNILFLLGMFLSAMAAWALAVSVTGDALASLVAGLVYAFVPWRLAQLPHIQFQWGCFLALLLLFLLRYLDRGRSWDAALFGVFLAWNALCNIHYALFSGILVAVVVAYRWLTAEDISFRRKVAGALLAMTIASIAVVPFYVPYARVSTMYGMRRDYGEIEAFSGRPIDFLTAGPQNKLYAPLTQHWAQPEGDFFPGLSVLALASAALLRPRSPRPERAGRSSPGRRRVAGVLDVLLLAGVAFWAFAVLAREPVIGPLKLRDPGRILVFLTALLFFRLLLAFPRRSRFANLRDFLRRMSIGSPAGLLLTIGATGVFVALGTHTPYYRFLVQSFGPVFRAIRVPARGIVLFDLAAGVLAAWGFSALTRRISSPKRRLAMAGAILAIGLEYRAFPVDVRPVEKEPAPVYHWLAGVPLPGAVIEWPLADNPDVEHVFRAAVHWKPLINGYSGFAPPGYQELSAMLAANPISDRVWEKLRGMQAALLIFHPHEIEGDNRLAYVHAVRRGIAGRKLTTLGSFPNGASRDYVFRVAGVPLFDPLLPQPDRSRAAADAERRLARLESAWNVPFGFIDAPKENETVAAGSWVYGWALDDSGIASVEVSAETGAPSAAAYGQPHPGIASAYPNYPDANAAGFGFSVPLLPPGEHTLTVTIVARDGGKAELKRRIHVR